MGPQVFLFPILLLKGKYFPSNIIVAVSFLPGACLSAWQESEKENRDSPPAPPRFSIPQEPLFPVFWLEKKGAFWSFWSFFCLHLLCSPWIQTALESELGDVEWKKSGHSLPSGLFFRI